MLAPEPPEMATHRATGLAAHTWGQSSKIGTIAAWGGGGGRPPPPPEALVLAYWGGLTAEEIARRTGAPLGTAKSRLRLGLTKLREVLGSDGEAATALAA